jgi:hypothetical protein
MLTLVLLICVAMVMYGIARFAIAKYRRRENPAVHMLWIPAAAFVYFIGISTAVLASMA